jgi:predicted esterase
MRAHSIATTIHGRYLSVAPTAAGSGALLAGFHGYGEDAETQLERLRAIPGSERRHVIAIQGLHRFYERRTNRVVASWMTRQDRESAIADNMAYVQACMEAECAAPDTAVFAGFSQGVAMAFRAAARHRGSVIAVGGDVPPELESAALGTISSVLVARGVSDEWYKAEHFAKDQQRLRDAGVRFRAVTLQCGHDWTPELTAAAAEFLAEFPV